MYIRLFISLLVLLLGAGLAFAQDEDFDRQELFEAVRLATPGETLTSLPAKFEFPDHARAGSIFGIDVSHHNFDGCKCTFDWADVASHKVQFVYVKATQGTSYADPTFARSVAGARDARARRTRGCAAGQGGGDAETRGQEEDEGAQEPAEAECHGRNL